MAAHYNAIPGIRVPVEGMSSVVGYFSIAVIAMRFEEPKKKNQGDATRELCRAGEIPTLTWFWYYEWQMSHAVENAWKRKKQDTQTYSRERLQASCFLRCRADQAQ